MPRIRVLVADDHREMVSAILAVLAEDDRFLVVGTAFDGDEACRIASDSDADLVLLDVRMPGGGPAAALRLRQSPRPPVVVAISADSGAATVAQMLRAGAVGYLAKGRIGAALPDFLLRCVAGEVVLATPSAAEALRSLVHRPEPTEPMAG